MTGMVRGAALLILLGAWVIPGCLGLNLTLAYLDQHIPPMTTSSKAVWTTVEEAEIYAAVLAHQAAKVTRHSIAVQKFIVANDTAYSQAMSVINDISGIKSIVTSKIAVAYKTSFSVPTISADQFSVSSLLVEVPQMFKIGFNFYSSIRSAFDYEMMVTLLQQFGWSHIFIVSGGEAEEPFVQDFQLWLRETQPGNNNTLGANISQCADNLHPSAIVPGQFARVVGSARLDSDHQTMAAMVDRLALIKEGGARMFLMLTVEQQKVSATLRAADSAHLLKNTAWFVNPVVFEYDWTNEPNLLLFNGMLAMSASGNEGLTQNETVTLAKSLLPEDETFSDDSLSEYFSGIVLAADTVTMFAAALDLMVDANVISGTSNDLIDYILQVDTEGLSGRIHYMNVAPYVQSVSGLRRGQRKATWWLYNLQVNQSQTKTNQSIEMIRVSDQIDGMGAIHVNTSLIIWPNETQPGRQTPPDLGVIEIGAMWSYPAVHCAIRYAIDRMNAAVCSNPSSKLCQFNISFRVHLTEDRVTSSGFSKGDTPSWVNEYVEMASTSLNPEVKVRKVGFLGSGWSQMAGYLALIQNVTSLGFPSMTVSPAATLTTTANMYSNLYFVQDNPTDQEAMYSMASYIRAVGMVRVGVFTRNDDLSTSWRDAFMLAMQDANYSYSQFSTTLTVKTDLITGDWDYALLETEAKEFARNSLPILVSCILGELIGMHQFMRYGKILVDTGNLGLPTTMYFGTWGQALSMEFMNNQMYESSGSYNFDGLQAYAGAMFIERMPASNDFFPEINGLCNESLTFNESNWSSGSYIYAPYGFNGMWAYYTAIEETMNQHGSLMPSLTVCGDFMNKQIRNTWFRSEVTGFGSSYQSVPTDFQFRTGSPKSVSQIQYVEPPKFAIYNLCTRTECGASTTDDGSSRRTWDPIRMKPFGVMNLLGTVTAGAPTGQINLTDANRTIQFGASIAANFAAFQYKASRTTSTCPAGYYFLDSATICAACDKDTYRTYTDPLDTCTRCPHNSITLGEGSQNQSDCKCNAGSYFYVTDDDPNSNNFICEECPDNWRCPLLTNQSYLHFNYLPKSDHWASCTDPASCSVYSCPFSGQCAGSDLVDVSGWSSCYPLPDETYDSSCPCSDHSEGPICGMPESGYYNFGNTQKPEACESPYISMVVYYLFTVLYIAFLTWAGLRAEFMEGTSPRGSLLWVFVGNLQTLVMILGGYASAIPSWGELLMHGVGPGLSTGGGIAVFQRTSEVIECGDNVLSYYGDTKLVANVLLLSLALLVPFTIFRSYVKIVLPLKTWFLEKVDRCRRRNIEKSPAELKQDALDEEKRIQRLKENMMAVGNSGLFLLSPAGIEQILRFVHCRAIDSELLLEICLEEECYTGVHLVWLLVLCIPAVLYFGVATPCFQSYHLFQNKAQLQKRDPELSITKTCGLLFLPFENHYWWWSSVVLWRKVLFAACLVVLAPLGQRVQSVTGFVVLNTALVFHVRHRPFLHDDTDRLEFWSLVFTQTTLFMFIIATDLGTVGQSIAFCTMILQVVGMVVLFIQFWIRNSVLSDNNQGKHGDVGRKVERDRFDHKEGKIYRGDKVVAGANIFEKHCTFCEAVYYAEDLFEEHLSVCPRRPEADDGKSECPTMGDQSVTFTKTDVDAIIAL